MIVLQQRLGRNLLGKPLKEAALTQGLEANKSEELKQIFLSADIINIIK